MNLGIKGYIKKTSPIFSDSSGQYLESDKRLLEILIVFLNQNFEKRICSLNNFFNLSLFKAEKL